MQFVKQFSIIGVNFLNSQSHPISLTIWPDQGKSTIRLDQKTLDRFGFNVTQESLRKMLECTFTTIVPTGDPDELLIDEVVRQQKLHVCHGSWNEEGRPTHREHTEAFVKASTPTEGGSICIRPCPYFDLSIPLKIEEFDELIKLPLQGQTALKISLALKDRPLVASP
jgi:hypothetical protein